MAELQRVLGEQGQCLPLDPPLPEEATAGGVIAANASGPLRLRHGTVRDMLIGIKVVGADGSITKGGGKVVKNVTGYDMGKLYTGSLGTLGIIVEASFKLAPLPAREVTVRARFVELATAYEAARAIYRGGLPVRACELLSPKACEADDRYELAIWIAGGQASVERQRRDVASMCHLAAEHSMLEGGEAKALWRQIKDFGHSGAGSRTKLSVLPSHTGELLAKLPPDSLFVSHVLSGVTYVADGDPEQLACAAREMGGHGVVEACPLDLKQRLDVWGPAGPDFTLMERIKREFDPRGILNPGRYVGRL
jgi:glycolate oxidase FAD binding subunit